MAVDTEAVINALMAPWAPDPRVEPGTGWVLHLGTNHIITLTRLNDGWQWKWERAHLTIGEERGYADPGGCRAALAAFVFKLADEYLIMSNREALRRIGP